MSANRILLLAAVLIAVLFGVSLALGSRNSDRPVDPKASSFNKWIHFKNVNPGELTARGGRLENGQWSIDRNILTASLDVAPSKDNTKIRRLSLSLAGGDPFEVRFTPLPDTNHPTKLADANASPLRITKFEAGKPPLQLTILEHGGKLDVQRLANTKPAGFKLD